MRRAAFAAAAVVAVVPLLSGCSGAEALRAEQLLNEASQAQKQLKSESFTGRMTFTTEGRHVVLKIAGGGYSRGPRAGATFT